VAIGRQAGAMAAGYWPVLATLLWGGVVMLLIGGSMVRLVRRLIARVALPLVVLSLILIDEVDNAYGDAYSGSVSAHSLWPRWSVRRWGVVVALACTAFALVLPMHSLEPFLLLLSSVFAHAGALLRNARGVHGLPVVLWLAGIACYHLLPRVLPGMGAALPTLAVCFVLAFATRPRNATE
jgi:hypothetical protein